MSNSPAITVVVDDQKEIGGPGFIICRDSYTAKLVLAHLEPEIDVLWIDFDLGSNSESGAEILKWLFGRGYKCPSKIRIISLNPPGRIEMEGILRDNCYVPVDEDDLEFYGLNYWIPRSLTTR